MNPKLYELLFKLYVYSEVGIMFKDNDEFVVQLEGACEDIREEIKEFQVIQQAIALVNTGKELDIIID